MIVLDKLGVFYTAIIVTGVQILILLAWTLALSMVGPNR